MLSVSFVPNLNHCLHKDDNLQECERVNVNLHTPEAALSYIREKILNKEGFALATLNLDHVVKLTYLKPFLDAYRRHDAITADGFPIVWLGRLLGNHLKRTTGSDLFMSMIALAYELKVRIALVGTTTEALNIASEKIKARFPGLEIGFMESPAFSFDPASGEAVELLRRIESSGSCLCFLAFGAPKQELLASLGRDIAPSVGFASIGASIDFVAGSQRRAPKWAQVCNVEWLWRLLNNPQRLFKRYVQCALIFPVIVFTSLWHAWVGYDSRY